MVIDFHSDLPCGSTIESDIKIASEGFAVPKRTTVPEARQIGIHGKGSEPGRADPEKSFSKDAAIESAFGRKMPL